MTKPTYIGIASVLSGAASGLNGFIQGINYTAAPVTAESKRTAGTTAREYFFEDEISVSVDLEVDSSVSTLPGNGDIFAVTGCKDADFNRSYVQTNKTLKEAGTVYQVWTIQGKSKKIIDTEVKYKGIGASA